MTKYLIFGHKNPDTDAISAAIAMSYFLEKSGEEAEPVALGPVNDETAFALKKFNCEAPRVVSQVSQEVSHVALVDHNEPQQSVEDLGQVQVDYVVDHHRIQGFETAQPLYYRAEPIGCTSTILYKLFKEHDFDIPQAIAGLMLSAIISDTLLFKSPTSTHQDKDAAVELAKIADVNLEEYGLELLKSGTNLDSKSEADIVNGDAKNFTMAGRNVRVSQVNVVGFDDILTRKDALLTQMKADMDAYNYDLSLLVITDILESTSLGLVQGKDAEFVEKAFAGQISDQAISLPGVVSRKKQVVPQLTQAFEQ
ncbi:manganese-dependent inorganic pyrophosphatase [Ignavigranum ruoffiae]|uniref:manganese-dependent inorganic pyrophosphatase n=1 Tax=Ignavigranum ruoffiae TaxID=89093 RepID=UPI0024ADC1EE|nr:manganese-dependent inorganic pyrophosphatase [Ignavigranum ruoffiae]